MSSGLKDRLTGIATFIWNGEEKTFLGRGGRSWGEIGLFYLIYYICLGGFFVGMLAVFYQTMDTNRPKLVGDSSLLKGNPGMGFKPMTNVEYTLIRYTKNPKSHLSQKTSIHDIIEHYTKTEGNRGIPCSKDSPAPVGEACSINTTALLAKCNEANHYGYKDNQPCVLLRLNKIFDWMPEPYTEENIKDSGASKELQEKILADPGMIYIDCVGENPADRDNLGPIEYYPEQGYRHFYYPFTNQAEYMSPLVFVKFTRPPANMAMMVECRALAPNIRYDKAEKEGGVHFELLADP